MGKPKRETIRRALPLSDLSARGELEPILVCNICGERSAELGLWRECDEDDQPIARDDVLVYIGGDHPRCHKFMQDHPRLYIEERGGPGFFPRLCGPCIYRRGASCAHVDLKANGGAGLNVSFDNGHFANAILCTRGSRTAIVHHAVECTGRQTPAHENGATP